VQIAISEENIKTFQRALEALNAAEIPYVVGGAFAMHYYSGVWRNTNDLDVYLPREYLPRAIRALSSAGFRDYGQMAAGDREWIYHAVDHGVLVDLIWQTPHHLSSVDQSMYDRGPSGTFVDIPVRFIPADELVWAKMFTINRHRCDWPDIFNVVKACPEGIDWNYLTLKMGEHWPVLLSFIVLFDWAYPGESGCIPEAVREDLLRKKQESSLQPENPSHEAVLDPWFYSRPISP